jgi:small subunit ribosomal protein S16
MLVIRLFRAGKTNQPFFKIVVTDKKNPPRGGRFLEEVGFLNPITKEKSLKEDRIKYWISVGAKPSETVYNLLIENKILEGEKIAVHQEKEIKEEEKKEEIKVENKPEEEIKDEPSQETKAEDNPKEEAKEESKEEKKEEIKEDALKEENSSKE